MSDYNCDVRFHNHTDLAITSWTMIYDEGSKQNSALLGVGQVPADGHITAGTVNHTKGGHAVWTVLITFAGDQPNYVYTKIDFGPPNQDGLVTWNLTTAKTGDPESLNLSHQWTTYGDTDAAVEAAEAVAT